MTAPAVTVVPEGHVMYQHHPQILRALVADRQAVLRQEASNARRHRLARRVRRLRAE